MLFKKDSKWKIRFWDIETQYDVIIQNSWLVWGKAVTSKSISKPKNVWRSNETTWPEQAILEMESKIKKKLDEWYFKTQKEAEEKEVILPMLAHSYDKHYNKIDWSGDVFVQPKLDWMRALVIFDSYWVEIISRKWKKIETMDHIKNSFLWTSMRYWIYDWELYAHWLSFQENMKLIKKYREWESEKVKFHLYDKISPKSRKERMDINIFDLERVSTFQITSEEELKKRHALFISEWYEWTMIRHWDSWYETDKRSYSLLKYKDFLDESYEIVDIIPSEKRPEQWVIVCKIWDKTFRANPKMSHKERAELLTNKNDIIGKMAEIRFFEYSDDWIPRFPVFIWVRLDK